MLTKIHLHNFQKHADLILDLEKITILRGGSDRGKSAVVRALYWVFFNRPLGSEAIFKKKGTKEFFVKLEYDGHTIIRGVDKEGHFYSLNGEVFRAVGTDIPAAVSKALNVGALNIGTQHEGPFLFNMSQGEASRYISSLVGLEEKDKALSLIERNRREVNTDINNLRQERQKVIEKTKHLRKVKRMVSDIKAIEEIKIQIDEKQENKNHVTNIVQKLKSLQKVFRYEKLLLKISNLVNDLLQKTEKKTGVFSIVSEIKNVQLKIKKADNIKEAELLCKQLISEQEAKKDLFKKKKTFSDIILQYKSNLDKIKSMQKEIKNLQKRWEKETEGFCPLCGNEMDVT